MAQEILTGKVKFFEKIKGFGFIIPDNSNENLFFHHSACNTKDIKQDDLVSFSIGETKRGPCAENVVIL